MRALIVDEQPYVRGVLKFIFDELGYRVYEACNGLEAINCLGASFNDIFMIILDQKMPVMDGLTALLKIKQDIRFSHIPVVMLTSERDPDKIQEMLNAGAEGLIAKPSQMEALTDNISAFIDKTKGGGHA